MTRVTPPPGAHGIHSSFTCVAYIRDVLLSRMLVPTLVGIGGAALSAVAIATPSVWFDEAATVSASTRTVPQLVDMLGTIDAVHGLYYLLMHLVFGGFGYSVLSLRLVSALAVGVAAALVVVLDRQLRPTSHGIVAGIAFCMLPRVTWMGGEGRSFALTAVMAALLSVMLLLALRRRTPLSWLAYGLVAAIGCMLFLYFALVVVAHGVSVFIHSRRALAPWACASLGAAIVLIPFALLVMSESAQLPSTPPLGWRTVNDVFLGQWFGESIPFAVVAVALLALGARQGWLILPALVVPTSALLLGALINPELYQSRYLSMATPFLALGIAAGVARIRWRAGMVAVVLLLIGLGIPPLLEARAADAKKDRSWSRISEIVANERAALLGQPKAGIVFAELAPHSRATARVITIAYPAPFDGLVDVTLDWRAADSGMLWSTSLPLDRSLDRLDGVDTVFLIGTDIGADEVLLRREGFARVSAWVEGGVTVLQLRR